MNKSTTNREKCHFTPRATLAAIRLKMRQLGIFRSVARGVKISQKVVRYIPAQKLQDGFITILTGAQGLVETNKRVHPDRGLQRVFGRDGCAEQSVISETLNACTPENVEEMYQVMKDIYQLPRVFQILVQAAEEVLDLDDEKRQRTILRMDGHGGSQDDVNWARRKTAPVANPA